MISRTCARLAKPFISLGEMNPVARCPPRRGSKRIGGEIGGRAKDAPADPDAVDHSIAGARDRLFEPRDRDPGGFLAPEA